jgi:hypothetical protein
MAVGDGALSFVLDYILGDDLGRSRHGVRREFAATWLETGVLKGHHAVLGAVNGHSDPPLYCL